MYFVELFLDILQSTSQLFDVRLESFHLQVATFLQLTIALVHYLQVFCHLL